MTSEGESGFWLGSYSRILHSREAENWWRRIATNTAPGTCSAIRALVTTHALTIARRSVVSRGDDITKVRRDFRRGIYNLLSAVGVNLMMRHATSELRDPGDTLYRQGHEQ